MSKEKLFNSFIKTLRGLRSSSTTSNSSGFEVARDIPRVSQRIEQNNKLKQEISPKAMPTPPVSESKGSKVQLR